MPSRKKLSRSLNHPARDALKRAKLYLILDTEVRNYDSLFEIAQQAALNGVDVLQLRDKKGNAKDILNFCKGLLKFLRQNSPDVPLIVNDRVDLALAAGAGGVHLGQEDLSIAFARKILGPQALIGASCQNLKQAQLAEGEGADYIGFGSVFKTKTKPRRSPMDLKLLEEVFQKIKIPVFAIGGIDPQNAAVLQRSGVRRIAVCRAVCEMKDVKQATKALKEKMAWINSST